MNARRVERPSDSPLVARITHVRYERDTNDVTTPDGCWDLVVMKVGGRVMLLQTGLITRPVALPYGAGDEYLAISFKPGVFRPRMPGARMRDRGLLLPSQAPGRASRGAFWLERERLEIPTFDNAEGLVDRLARRELIVRDEIVEGIVEGRPRAISPRSVQRHFLQALGMTAKRLEQIQRARQAVELLRQGRRLVDVALELGYADQPHLTRQLKALMGQTPGEIAAAAPRPR
jgi:hypothetical protein